MANDHGFSNGIAYLDKTIEIFRKFIKKVNPKKYVIEIAKPRL